MPVEQVPGFWDYLGQGIMKGVEMHRQSEDKMRAEAHAKTAEAQASAGLMAQLFQSGAIDNTQLQGALKAAGINPDQIQVMPNKAQQRRQVLAGGDAALAQLTDEQKKDLGFTSAAQAATEGATAATAKAATSGANIEVQKNDILSRYLQGDKLNDQELAATGLPSAQDRELKRLGAMDPYLDQLGGRYVAGVMVQNKGRINPGTAQQTAEQAYANYVAERGQNGLGALTPEQVAYTRSYFQRATENALIAQQKMDIDASQAGSQRIHANAAMQAAGQNTNLKWFGQVNSAMENIRKAQSDLMRSNPALGPALDNPQLAQSPMVKGALQRYMELEQTAEAFRGAQGALANGQVPGNLSALLDAAGQIATQGAGPAGAPGAGARGRGAPPPAGGPAQQGGARPASGSPDPIGATVDAIVAGRATLQDAQALVSQGKMTQQQYQQIAQQVQAKSSTKKK